MQATAEKVICPLCKRKAFLSGRTRYCCAHCGIEFARRAGGRFALYEITMDGNLTFKKMI